MGIRRKITTAIAASIGGHYIWFQYIGQVDPISYQKSLCFDGLLFGFVESGLIFPANPIFFARQF